MAANKVDMPRKNVPPPLELVKSRIEERLPPDAREDVEGGALLVDVRDSQRFEAGHIEGAVNLDAGQSAVDAHDEEFAKKVEEAAGDRSRRLILYCGEGNRSARASDALRNEHGFASVASIIGGITLWRDLGYPIEGEIEVDISERESTGEVEGDTT
jgi:sulfur-carrier protein adenylyltransferase/sulfurtransferase